MESKTKILIKKQNTVTREAKREQTQHKTITVRAKQTTKTIKPLQGENNKNLTPSEGEQQQKRHMEINKMKTKTVNKNSTQQKTKRRNTQT